MAHMQLGSRGGEFLVEAFEAATRGCIVPSSRNAPPGYSAIPPGDSRQEATIRQAQNDNNEVPFERRTIQREKRRHSMKSIFRALVALSFLASTAVTLHAQDQSMAPPKVLVIYREIIKFGKDAPHEKNEVAFVRAFAAGKSPERYIAATTMSGVNEAWFLTPFDSYASWEKSSQFNNQAAIEAPLARLSEQDGEYVADGRQIVATYDEKSSYRPNFNMAEMRYVEIETIRVRPGHDKEWGDLVTFYNTAATKAKLDEHDVFFSVRYGAQAGTILIVTPRKSLADLDAAADDYKAMMTALGDEGRKRWAQLLESTIAFDSSELLRFSPKMSYAPDDFVKADPSFWKPKTAPATKANSAGSATKKPTDAPK